MENQVNWRLGKILDGRYQIVSVVGIGGMAVVYQAYDLIHKRDVAVKVLRDDVSMDQESRRQFRKEYQAVEKLDHPNIRAVYDVVVSGDTEYIVMEYVDGINLKQYMREKGTLSWQEVLHFSTQITRALDHAHSRGIIHMDIKPQNIMLPKDGTVKIADFGIAQMEESEPEDVEEAIGSIHYISPEQARGGSVDARSDIYSLGVVMYEMLTGRLPFEGKTLEEVAVQQVSVKPPAPSSLNPAVPPELERITQIAMSPHPDDRYASAKEMLADLDAFRRSRVAPPPMPEKPSRQEQTTQPEILDGVHVITKDVPRISRSGELSRKRFSSNRSRSASVSLLSGIVIVMAFALALFVFVWQYWLRDIFQDAERIEIGSLVGLNASDVLQDPQMKELYDFQVVYQSDPNHDKGIILSQSPEAGASRMITSEGIEMTLTVSSGIEQVTIPLDVTSAPYTNAQVRLEALGLNVNIVLEESDTVSENYVISSDPAPGTSVPGGSEVTLHVSAGATISYTTVPNVVGMTKESALLTLQREGLICGNSEMSYVSSSEEETNRVMWQSYDSGTQVIMGTQVYLQIGTGPAGSGQPAPGG